ncbi:hypothetical protein [Haliangium sp.]|uniref:hypothetical protein n=1 Tax=Haliangium sp. TaxID=2663208 RepID=UPI003D11EC69
MPSLRSALLLLPLSLSLAAPAACQRTARDPVPPPSETSAAQPIEQRPLAVAAAASDPAASAVASDPATSAATDPAAPPAAEIAHDKRPGKPLSKNVHQGLDWLVSHQLPSGGWGQGDESPQMRGNAQQTLRDTANVADTSMALLALMRTGSTPSAGTYSAPIRRGIEFILSEVEASDEESLFVTNVRGTRVQGKIGTYVDTFTGLLALTEVKGKMPDAKSNKRVDAALTKVLNKIERNQQADGTWANQGWAPVLTQSLAAKGLNRAAQSGEDVDEDTLRRVEDQAASSFDTTTGAVSGAGSAGVDLYSRAANSASLRDSMTTRKTKEGDLRRQASSGKTETERREAQQKLAENSRAEQTTEAAEKALLDRLDDPSFIQGFGNNGGEEFLSYMLVSEALAAKGGEEWTTWDAKISKLVNRVQNGDGSWTGHHCITGRTFCTAAALLVLMADRGTGAVAAQIQHG